MKSRIDLNVSLTLGLMKMVRQQVESGRYHSANDVICDGLRLLEKRERKREAFWADVCKKVAEAKAEMRAGKGIPADEFRRNMDAYIKRAQEKR